MVAKLELRRLAGAGPKFGVLTKNSDLSNKDKLRLKFRKQECVMAERYLSSSVRGNLSIQVTVNRSLLQLACSQDHQLFFRSGSTNSPDLRP